MIIITFTHNPKKLNLLMYVLIQRNFEGKYINKNVPCIGFLCVSFELYSQCTNKYTVFPEHTYYFSDKVDKNERYSIWLFTE